MKNGGIFKNENAAAYYFACVDKHPACFICKNKRDAWL
jgi:hypothetical protein